MTDDDLVRILRSNHPEHLGSSLIGVGRGSQLPGPYRNGRPGFFSHFVASENFVRDYLGNLVPGRVRYPAQLLDGSGQIEVRIRIPDAVVKTDAEKHLHEAKIGFVQTVFAKNQIKKDCALKRAGSATDVTWHFLASDRTGRIGPSDSLRKSLEDCEIDYIIHLP